MNYKNFLDLQLSEIGIGTYLGNPDPITNESYKNTIKKGIELGVNVVDTAINTSGEKLGRSMRFFASLRMTN